MDNTDAPWVYTRLDCKEHGKKMCYEFLMEGKNYIHHNEDKVPVEDLKEIRYGR